MRCNTQLVQLTGYHVQVNGGDIICVVSSTIDTTRVASGIIGTIIYLICLLLISSLVEAEGLVASHRSPVFSHLSFGTDTQTNQSLALMSLITTHDVVIQLTDITLIDQPRLT